MITEVPYDQRGNLLHYPSVPLHLRDRYPGDTTDWRPNEPFQASLTLVRQERGRSAAYFIFDDGRGHEYPMFMTDIADVLTETVVDHGTVTGRWVVGKRGQNYGIRLAKGMAP